MKSDRTAPLDIGTHPSLFTRLSQHTAHAAGKPLTFTLAAGFILAWAISGPFFGFSETWQLIVNTTTTIVTFLMVFVIQNSQNRDTAALQIKLDELLSKVEGAREELMDLEEMDQEEISAIQEEFEARARRARRLREQAPPDAG